MAEQNSDVLEALSRALSDTDPDPTRRFGSGISHADRRRAGALYEWLRAHGWDLEVTGLPLAEAPRSSKAAQAPNHTGPRTTR